MFTSALAQERIVTGTIVDESGRTMPGVNVSLRGTLIGTASDADGRFSIPVASSDAILVFTFVGYNVRERVVGNLSVVDVDMQPSVQVLSELVVVGYGVQQKKDVTGSIAIAEGEELSAIPTSNIENNFQGRLAGVNVISSGEPGSTPLVIIRGASTFAGSSQPLYVVDGVPTLDISTINPGDVESVTALKDAGAASIYGSRAANGVILITTKKGTNGTMKLSYNGYYGIQSPGKGITNLLDTQGYADLTWLAYQNSGETPPSGLYGSGPTPVIPDYYKPAGKFEGEVDESTYNRIDSAITRANKKGTDWYDEITNYAPIQNHDLAVSGGGENSRYFVGLNYFDQEGIVMYTGAKRFSMRINTEFSIKDKIRIGQNLTNVYRANSAISPNTNAGRGPTAILDSYLTPTILPVYDIAGNFAFDNQPWQTNPYATQSISKDNRSYAVRTFGNVFAEVDFLKAFTLRTAFGGSFEYVHFYEFRPRLGLDTNTFTEGTYDFADWNWQNLLTFRKNINTHTFNVIAGVEMIKSDISRSVGGTRQNYLYEDPDYLMIETGNANGQTNFGINKTPSTLLGFFGRLDYNFRDRYLVSLTVRRDGSSKFIKHRYGTFPAATLAWHVSEESFFKAQTFFNDLKIRFGYGIMGDQINASANNSYSIFNSDPGGTYYDIKATNNTSVFGIAKTFSGNPEGQWQENETMNLGIDFSLFNSKLNGSVDLYKKITDKLLYTLEPPATNGIALPSAKNVGEMENKGIDMMLGYTTEINRKWKFECTLTFTSYSNKVVKIADNEPYFQVGEIVRIQPGYPISSFYGYRVEGLWQSDEEIQQANVIDGDASSAFQQEAKPGRFRFEDINNDGKINADDRTFIGNPNPDFSAGLNLSLYIGNFDFNAFLFGVQGNDIYNTLKNRLYFFNTSTGAKSADLLYNSWTPQRTNTTIPIAEQFLNFSNGASVNSFYIEDGSYLRLKNIQVGYTLPKDFLQRTGLSKARLYLQAVNLFTIKDTLLPDPEIGGSVVSFGVGGAVYPTTQQFIMGVNVEF